MEKPGNQFTPEEISNISDPEARIVVLKEGVDYEEKLEKGIKWISKKHPVLSGAAQSKITADLFGLKKRSSNPNLEAVKKCVDAEVGVILAENSGKEKINEYITGMSNNSKIVQLIVAGINNEEMHKIRQSAFFLAYALAGKCFLKAGFDRKYISCLALIGHEVSREIIP